MFDRNCSFLSTILSALFFSCAGYRAGNVLLRQVTFLVGPDPFSLAYDCITVRHLVDVIDVVGNEDDGQSPFFSILDIRSAPSAS